MWSTALPMSPVSAYRFAAAMAMLLTRASSPDVYTIGIPVSRSMGKPTRRRPSYTAFAASACEALSIMDARRSY